MEESISKILELGVSQGIWAALYIYLFFRMLKENKEREDRYKQFLGYKKGANGIPEIVPEEAATIKLIYRLFIEGKSPAYIARFLSSCNIPSPAGRPQWRPETVKSILSNEKYKGDAILQKTFCTDFLTKKMKVNEGEVPQYYVENSHPANHFAGNV